MRYDKLILCWFPEAKSLRTGRCLVCSHCPSAYHRSPWGLSQKWAWLWYSCETPLTWLSSPACKSAAFSRLSFTTSTHQSKNRGKEEMHPRTTPVCLLTQAIRLVCPVWFIAYLPPLIVEWWHHLLYLQWIKTETDASSSSGNPSPEWMGFRWPLMLESSVGPRCFVFMLSLIVTGRANGKWRCAGKDRFLRRTACGDHWDILHRHIDKDSKLFLFALCTRICPISSLPEACRCSDRNRNIFSPCWPGLMLTRDSPLTPCSNIVAISAS